MTEDPEQNVNDLLHQPSQPRRKRRSSFTLFDDILSFQIQRLMKTKFEIPKESKHQRRQTLVDVGVEADLIPNASLRLSGSYPASEEALVDFGSLDKNQDWKDVPPLSTGHPFKLISDRPIDHSTRGVQSRSTGSERTTNRSPSIEPPQVRLTGDLDPVEEPNPSYSEGWIETREDVSFRETDLDTWHMPRGRVPESGGITNSQNQWFLSDNTSLSPHHLDLDNHRYASKGQRHSRHDGTLDSGEKCEELKVADLESEFVEYPPSQPMEESPPSSNYHWHQHQEQIVAEPTRAGPAQQTRIPLPVKRRTVPGETQKPGNRLGSPDHDDRAGERYRNRRGDFKSNFSERPCHSVQAQEPEEMHLAKDQCGPTPDSQVMLQPVWFSESEDGDNKYGQICPHDSGQIYTPNDVELCPTGAYNWQEANTDSVVHKSWPPLSAGCLNGNKARAVGQHVEPSHLEIGNQKDSLKPVASPGNSTLEIPRHRRRDHDARTLDSSFVSVIPEQVSHDSSLPSQTGPLTHDVSSVGLHICTGHPKQSGEDISPPPSPASVNWGQPHSHFLHVGEDNEESIPVGRGTLESHQGKVICTKHNPPRRWQEEIFARAEDISTNATGRIVGSHEYMNQEFPLEINDGISHSDWDANNNGNPGHDGNEQVIERATWEVAVELKQTKTLGLESVLGEKTLKEIDNEVPLLPHQTQDILQGVPASWSVSEPPRKMMRRCLRRRANLESALRIIDRHIGRTTQLLKGPAIMTPFVRSEVDTALKRLAGMIQEMAALALKLGAVRQGAHVLSLLQLGQGAIRHVDTSGELANTPTAHAITTDNNNEDNARIDRASQPLRDTSESNTIEERLERLAFTDDTPPEILAASGLLGIVARRRTGSPLGNDPHLRETKPDVPACRSASDVIVPVQCVRQEVECRFPTAPSVPYPTGTSSPRTKMNEVGNSTGLQRSNIAQRNPKSSAKGASGSVAADCAESWHHVKGRTWPTVTRSPLCQKVYNRLSPNVAQISDNVLKFLLSLTGLLVVLLSVRNYGGLTTALDIPSQQDILKVLHLRHNGVPPW